MKIAWYKGLQTELEKLHFVDHKVKYIISIDLGFGFGADVTEVLGYMNWNVNHVTSHRILLDVFVIIV